MSSPGADLLAAEAVPLLPVQGYTDDGLHKRAQRQNTWALRRGEDAIDAEIDVQEEARRQDRMKFVTNQANCAEPDSEALVWVRTELDKEFMPLRRDRKAREVAPSPYRPSTRAPISRRPTLAPARRPGRAEGALRQLPWRRARRRRQPAHCLGRLEPPEAGHRVGRLLSGHERH